MNSTQQPDFTELQSVLRAEADQVPYCDLGEGFLDDLYAKLKADTRDTKSTRWFNRFSLPEIPPLAWGGAVAATIVLGVFLGLSTNESNKSDGFTTAEKPRQTLVYVSVDERVDFTGSIPTFVTKPLEF